MVEEKHFYKRSSDVGWNWGEGFYEELGEYKKGFRYCFLNRLPFDWWLNLRAEWLHVSAFLVSNKDFEEELRKLDIYMKEIESLLSVKGGAVGRMGEHKAKVKDEKALKSLFKAQELINSMEARKGMLQPKREDPTSAMRKYGD